MNNPEIDIFGNKIWYDENGQCHREDGPALKYPDGSKEWFQHGKLHREDGPAIEDADGTQQWWIKGEQINVSSQEEFIRHLKLRAFW